MPSVRPCRLVRVTAVARTVRPPAIHHSSLSSSAAPESERPTVDRGASGALAATDRALKHILESAGFVDISAPFGQGFTAYLDGDPGPQNGGDLKASAVGELLAFVRDRIKTEASRSEQTQARVRPEAAVKLLT